MIRPANPKCQGRATISTVFCGRLAAGKGRHPVGDIGPGHHLPPDGLHLDPVPRLDPFGFGQGGADLHEHLGHHLRLPGEVPGHGPGLPVFRHPEGGGDDGILGIADLGHPIHLRFPHLHHRVGLLRRHIVHVRALQGLVVLRQGPFLAGPAGHEDPALAFGQHEKGGLGRFLGPHVDLGGGVDPLEVGDVGVLPGLGHRVPGEQGLGLIPGLALGVQRAAVVDDPAVHRPGKSPAGIEPQPGGVLLVPGRGLVVLLVRAGVVAGVDPATAGGGAVILQAQEVRELLFVRHGVAVDLLGHQVDVGSSP